MRHDKYSRAVLAHGIHCRQQSSLMEWNCKPALTMLVVDMALAAMNIMIKKAMQEGMNSLVFITLRHLVATLFMAPIAFFHERRCNFN